jgi:hypothetical protein
VATDSGGRFQVPCPSIPDGWIEVRARGKGSVFLSTDSPRAGPVTVRLRPEGRVRLTVDADAWPELTATLPGGPATWSPPEEPLRDPEDSWRALLVGLPGGPLRITGRFALEPGFGEEFRESVHHVEVVVVPGRTVDATLVGPRR